MCRRGPGRRVPGERVVRTWRQEPGWLSIIRHPSHPMRRPATAKADSASGPPREQCRPRSGLVLTADDDHGTVRVMHAVLADRAEQRLGESAVPAAADYQQV